MPEFETLEDVAEYAVKNIEPCNIKKFILDENTKLAKPLDGIEGVISVAIEQAERLKVKTPEEYLTELLTIDLKGKSILLVVKKFIADSMLAESEDFVEAFVMENVREQFGLTQKEVDNIIKGYKNEKKTAAKNKKTEYILKTAENGNLTRFGDFIVKDEGIFREKIIGAKDGAVITVEEAVTKTACKIEALGKNVDDGAILYRINFKDSLGEERSIWKANHEILQKTGVLGLLKDGMFFTEKNAGNMTEFFEAVINQEKNKLPREIAASRNGWKLDNKLFICGNVGYTDEGEKSVLQVNNPLADLYTKKGTLDAWAKGTEKLWEFPVMHMKIYLACTPVILTLLGIPSFVVEQRLHSGRMKTETSRVAASAWGNPVELQLTADSTKCGVLAHVEFNNNLATYIDEAKISPEIRDLVYMIANETGRSKSNKDHGLERAKNSTTVAIMTCENPILPDNAHTGELVRVVPLGWGVEELLSQEVVSEITETYTENYGLFGPLFLEKVFEQRQELKMRFNENLKKLPDGDSSTGDYVTSARAKRFYAAIATAGEIVETIFQEIGIKNMGSVELCSELYNQNVVASARFEPTYLKAYKAAAAMYARNAIYFVNEDKEESQDEDKEANEINHEINHEKYGWVKSVTLRDENNTELSTDICVCFDQKALKKLLKDEEYAVEGVLKDWREKELLYYQWEGEEGSKYKSATRTIRIKQGNKKITTRVYALPMKKMCEINGDIEESLTKNDHHIGKKEKEDISDILKALNKKENEVKLECVREVREKVLKACREQKGPIDLDTLVKSTIDPELVIAIDTAKELITKIAKRGGVILNREPERYVDPVQVSAGGTSNTAKKACNA